MSSFAFVAANGGIVWYTKLPHTFNNISGFDRLPLDKLAEHHFYPVVTIKPRFDKRTQWQEGPVWTFINTQVEAKWVNHDKPLKAVKAAAIQQLRKVAKVRISSRYPIHKQLNRNLPGAMTAEGVSSMDTFINRHRDACNAAKQAVRRAATNADVIDIVDDFMQLD